MPTRHDLARLPRHFGSALAVLALGAGGMAHDSGGGHGQGSEFALRFHGSSTNPPDCARIRIDDDAPGPNASAPCDVGAGSFTLEFWLRGELADNRTSNFGGDLLLADASWREGNVVLDRDVRGASQRKFGVSIAGGFVRFGLGAGDRGSDVEHTLEGNRNVLDGAWHHVACVRNARTGVASIYVDGALDFASPPATSTSDISYADNGVGSSSAVWNPYLVIGAEKHGAAAGAQGFDGYFDELRLWSSARNATEIEQSFFRVLPGHTPQLVGAYRFEEGATTTSADSSEADSPPATLISGAPGNGVWVAHAASSTNTAPVVLNSLPSGFQRTTLATGLEEPTSIEALPDGRLLVAELGGRIVVIDNGAPLAQPLIQIPVAPSFGDRGLLGLLVDSNFDTDPYIYVYYTTSEPRNRVSRFTVTGNTASLASEFVVWQNIELAAFDHFGGGLAFLADGTLVISTGDQFDSTNAQDLSKEHGKLLRVRANGAIPSNNPFLSVPGAQPTIWARGLRNPFRISVDPLDGTLWVGDVGGNGSSAWEEIDQGLTGANYGWPHQEGEACYTSNCSAFAAATFDYRHDDHVYHTGQDQGSVVAGVVYRANSFPQEYRGNLFVGDYANQWIRRIVFDANGQVTSDPVFIDAPDAGSPVDMTVGADGALDYISFGGSGYPASGTVYRVAYAVGGNQTPVAVLDATPRSGVPPLGVQFSSTGTFDPDAGPGALSYAWDFGDSNSSTAPSPQHTYTLPGVYQATLTVSDGGGATVSDPIAIEVGHPPVPAIATPLVGTTYAAGNVISFSGGATDPDDGSLPASNLSWLVQLHHAGHVHPFYGPISGTASGNFTVPSQGHPPEDTHYEIVLTATDSDGIARSTSRTLTPQSVSVVFDSWPQGVPVFVDGQAEDTPRTYTSLLGYHHALEAQRSYTLAGSLLLFGFWSDRRPQAHEWVAPASGGYVRAVYVPAVKITALGSITGASRNAQYSTTTTQVFDDPASPQSLSFGRVGGIPLQLGLEFPVQVPQGALVVSARISFTGAASTGSCIAKIWTYDVASAPAFSAGSSTALTAWAPLGSADHRWPVPGFTVGGTNQTPNLSDIVQEVIDRPDWAPGNVLGFVFDGSATGGTGLRSVRDFASGTPPQLTLIYAIKQAPPPIPPVIK